MATWSKLKSGEWGVKVEGKPSVGSVVEVKSKAGEIKKVKVVAIVWSDDSSSICAVEVVAGEASQSSSSSSSSKKFVHHSCTVCGVKASKYVKIYGSGECRDCYEERKMGY